MSTEELCATCAHRQHESDRCEARYHVTFEKGEVGDPCLCAHQAWWDKRRSPPDDPNRRAARVSDTTPPQVPQTEETQ